MRKSLKALGVVLALILLWVGLVASEWLPRPSARQLAARAAIEAEPGNVKGEHDAFAAFYFNDYDVPEAEVDAAARADAAAFKAWTQQPTPKQPFVSTAEGKYAKLPAAPNKVPDLCGAWDPDCLARVRRDPAATRERLAQFPRQLERAEGVGRFDHYRYGIEPSFDAPVAVPGGFNLLLSAAALDFIDGKTDAAFDRVCRATRAWRQLRSHADMLIIDMVGVANLSGAARLYAEMLAEQPAGFEPPCTDAFAPLSDAELDQCSVYRFEYLSTRNLLAGPLFGKGGTFADGQDRVTGAILNVLVNRRHGVDLAAGSTGTYCLPEHRARMLKRSAAAIPHEPGCSTFDYVVDPFGCLIFASAPPSWDDYYARVLDLDARFKLVQSALWLRRQPADGDRARQFDQRPAELKSEQPTSIDVAAGKLTLKHFDRRRGEVWEIPFAPAASPPPAG